MIGWLLLSAWFAVWSVVWLRRSLHHGYRRSAQLIALAFACLAVSLALQGTTGATTVAGFFFVSAVLIALCRLAWMIAHGLDPRSFRQTWRSIGNPDAWTGQPTKKS
jgi:hypothetical protein